jgi:hypothetical protein
MALVILKSDVTSTTPGPPMTIYHKDQYWWNTTSKAVEGPINFNDTVGGSFSLSTSTVIDSYSIGGGMTRQVRHNGSGGVNFTDIATSLDVLGDITLVTCNGASDGAIDLTVTGGDGTYTYAWTDPGPVVGPTTQDRTGLPAGVYSVVVTDGDDITGNASFIVTQPAVLAASAVVTDNSVDLSVSGGTSPYTYLWSDSATTQDRTGIPAGDYTCTVTDANGCTAEVEVTVTYVPTPPPIYTLSDFVLPYRFGDYPLYISTIYSGTQEPKNDLIPIERTDLCLDYGSFACKRPIYLTWFNRQGGWDYWLFDGLHEYSTEQSDGIGYLNSNNEERWASRGKVKKKIGVNSGMLTKGQIEIVDRIRNSIQIYQWDGVGFNISCKIEEATYNKYKESDKEFSIVFTMSQGAYIQIQRG